MNFENKKILHMALIENGVIAGCLNCENYDAKAERCHLFPTEPLPTVVIVYGCPKWDFMIPF
jgi:hypothetical protein